MSISEHYIYEPLTVAQVDYRAIHEFGIAGIDLMEGQQPMLLSVHKNTFQILIQSKSFVEVAIMLETLIYMLVMRLITE